MSALHWVADGEDGWRWELRRETDDLERQLGFVESRLEGKVIHYCSEHCEAWHVASNTVGRFHTMRQAAEWLLEQVKR
jgi:hypothetical protein